MTRRVRNGEMNSSSQPAHISIRILAYSFPVTYLLDESIRKSQHEMIISSNFQPSSPEKLDAFLEQFGLDKIESAQDGQTLVRFVADDNRRRLPGHIYTQATGDYEVVSVEDFAQALASLLAEGQAVEVRDVGYEYLEQNVYGRTIIVRWDGSMTEIDLDDLEQTARRKWNDDLSLR
jgi:hypothetical protein